MTEPWNLRQRLIIVCVVVGGPTGVQNVPFAVDIGASATLVSERVLREVGYTLSEIDDQVEVVDARGASRDD